MHHSVCWRKGQLECRAYPCPRTTADRRPRARLRATKAGGMQTHALVVEFSAVRCGHPNTLQQLSIDEYTKKAEGCAVAKYVCMSTSGHSTHTRTPFHSFVAATRRIEKTAGFKVLQLSGTSTHVTLI